MIDRTSARISLAIGLLIGGFFLWLAVRDVDLQVVGESLLRANLWLLIPFLVSLTLFYWLKAVRWAIFLRPTRAIASRDVVPAMMIGFAGNNVLPVRLGEVLRIVVLGNQHSIPKSTVLGTIVLERVFDVLTMLLLLTLAVYSSPRVSAELQAARSFILVAALMSVAITYAIAAPPRWLVTVLQPLQRLLPDRIRGFVDNKLVLLRQGFAILTQSSRLELVHVVSNSIVQWTLLGLCVYLSAIAFDVAVDPAAAVLILGLIVAGISLPSAPGFIGTIEYCFVLGLGLYGIDANTALAVGIYYHAAMFVSVTLAGFYCLRSIGARMTELATNASNLRDADS